MFAESPRERRDRYVRDDIPIREGIYEPRSIELPDGTIYSVAACNKFVRRKQYIQLLAGARWSRSYEFIYTPELPKPPRTEKFNVDPDSEKSPWQMEKILKLK